MNDPRFPTTILPKAFPGITPAEVTNLIASSEVKTYPAGTLLTKENAVEFTFYIILEGEVRVTKTINNIEDRFLNKLGPGDFFGEMALIHNSPRAATVTTLCQTTVLEIQKAAFDQVLQNTASVSIALTREISRRLRENDELAIEDLRQRAIELSRAYQQLSELEFARREFLTTIAHELRTPLMVANGFLLAIQGGKLEGEAMRGALDTVARNVHQIVTLVNDILFLQEMDLILPKFHSVNLLEILTDMVKELQEHAASNCVNLILSIAPGIPRLTGDSKSLERAFRALVDNAIKFSPEGGNVEIRARAENHNVFVEVEDHGIGIADDILPRIFDRFFHVEQVNSHLFRGIGLGLSIARQVIEQHGGDISVASKSGQGSLFTIRLAQDELEPELPAG